MELGYGEILLRLVLAVVLGGVVGYERETHNRPAGFRTHILVCVGATLIMLVSAYGFVGNLASIGDGVDPSRIAAQVVTGVGFLGAGTIMRQGNIIRGLTTAASLWVVSGIGLAVGIGFYAGAIIATFMVLVSLLLMGEVDYLLARRSRLKRMWIRGIDRPGLLGAIGGVLGNLGINIARVELSEAEYIETYKAEVISINFLLKIPARLNTDQFFRQIIALPGVLEMSWEGEEVVEHQNA